MSSPLNFLNSNYLQSIFNSALQSAGISQNPISSTGATPSQQADQEQLSPFAQMLSTLQQLQESNPTEYKQVTSQIATNLQSAAQQATNSGNTSVANQLNQLATDFTNASQSGQLPNIADLAQAANGGGGHHHHHHHGGGFDSSASSSSSTSGSTSSSSSSSSASSSASSPISSFLAAFQSNSAQNDSFDPLSIIMNTLNNAGITSTNS